MLLLGPDIEKCCMLTRVPVVMVRAALSCRHLYTRSPAMASFMSDVSPLVKAVKFSLKPLDVVSAQRYSFVCCYRHANGKLALLHASGFPSTSSGGVKDSAAQSMKRLFDTVSPLTPSANSVSPNSPPAERPGAGPSASVPASESLIGAGSGTPSARRPSANESATCLAGTAAAAGSAGPGSTGRGAP